MHIPIIPPTFVNAMLNSTQQGAFREKKGNERIILQFTSRSKLLPTIIFMEIFFIFFPPQSELKIKRRDLLNFCLRTSDTARWHPGPAPVLWGPVSGSPVSLPVQQVSRSVLRSQVSCWLENLNVQITSFFILFEMKVTGHDRNTKTKKNWVRNILIRKHF